MNEAMAMGGCCQEPRQLLSTTRSRARLVIGRATAPIAERRSQVWRIGHVLIQVCGFKRVARWAQCNKPGMSCDLTEFAANLMRDRAPRHCGNRLRHE